MRQFVDEHGGVEGDREEERDEVAGHAEFGQDAVELAAEYPGDECGDEEPAGRHVHGDSEGASHEQATAGFLAASGGRALLAPGAGAGGCGCVPRSGGSRGAAWERGRRSLGSGAGGGWAFVAGRPAARPPALSPSRLPVSPNSPRSLCSCAGALLPGPPPARVSPRRRRRAAPRRSAAGPSSWPGRRVAADPYGARPPRRCRIAAARSRRSRPRCPLVRRFSRSRSCTREVLCSMVCGRRGAFGPGTPSVSRAVEYGAQVTVCRGVSGGP